MFQGLAGKTLTIRVDVYDDAGRAGFAETSITVTEPKPEEEKIPVEIRSDRETIEEDGATDLTAFATPFADSGKLTYFWAESPQGAPGNVFRLEGKGPPGRLGHRERRGEGREGAQGRGDKERLCREKGKRYGAGDSPRTRRRPLPATRSSRPRPNTGGSRKVSPTWRRSRSSTGRATTPSRNR